MGSTMSSRVDDSFIKDRRSPHASRVASQKKLPRFASHCASVPTHDAYSVNPRAKRRCSGRVRGNRRSVAPHCAAAQWPIKRQSQNHEMWNSVKSVFVQWSFDCTLKFCGPEGRIWNFPFQDCPFTSQHKMLWSAKLLSFLFKSVFFTHFSSFCLNQKQRFCVLWGTGDILPCQCYFSRKAIWDFIVFESVRVTELSPLTPRGVAVPTPWDMSCHSAAHFMSFRTRQKGQGASKASPQCDAWPHSLTGNKCKTTRIWGRCRICLKGPTLFEGKVIAPRPSNIRSPWIASRKWTSRVKWSALRLHIWGTIFFSKYEDEMKWSEMNKVTNEQ